MNPLIVIWLSFALWNNPAGEADKSFFIQSILQDGFLCNASFSQSEHCECIRSAYDAFIVTDYPAFEGEISIPKISKKVIYEIKIYELSLNDYSWTLLHYEDQNCSGWYRISGYKENDFIHLYNKVLHYYTRSKKQVDNILSIWQQKLKVPDIDFPCLVETVKKKDNKTTCMISTTLFAELQSTIVTGADKFRTDYIKGQLYENYYSTFSRRLYQGNFPD